MKKAMFDYKAPISLIKYCFFLMLLLATFGVSAQTTRGKVQVVAPPFFDTLLAKRATLNKSGGGTTGYSSSYGYRVQIYSGSNRSSAFNAQAKFNKEFPEMRTYIVYKEPNFKVRAGDFRSRIEAERMKEQLKPWFPVMFIISEKINPPKTVITND
ncbi:SPOR domain-containing protein [Mucilaginibacter sp. RB4R14]|uniref:SPOR domain-containing protein n=1 Tax=Mucilaginibacter aurantiaciroseus TaxID=2949308 RepID=UPI0020907F90|nr:SPOR domain-containing protein [Mucilaginibacter aurantiaciroseus]MCO5935663.1 SPOR domain-containing protein [Mucilaginibacter aurantiaciroseus]